MNNLPEIFFDTETSGLKTMFDQLLSAFFLKEGFIETDEDTHLDVRCSMELSRLPEAEALIVNGTPLPSLVQENSLYNGIHEIVKFIDENTPSVWIAHNASFDSAILSNTIYQNQSRETFYTLMQFDALVNLYEMKSIFQKINNCREMNI